MSVCKWCDGKGVCDNSKGNYPEDKCQLCYGRGIVNYTCDNCDAVESCVGAFDSYCTDGDCLAWK